MNGQNVQISICRNQQKLMWSSTIWRSCVKVLHQQG